MLFDFETETTLHTHEKQNRDYCKEKKISLDFRRFENATIILFKVHGTHWQKKKKEKKS